MRSAFGNLETGLAKTAPTVNIRVEAAFCDHW